MTDLRKAAEMALDALNEVTGWQWAGPMRVMDEVEDAIEALRQALAQPKYHRGDRLLCLESEEYCVIHISGTDCQWVKFPDSHIGAYTNEQVQELFELLPKETDEALAQPEQESNCNPNDLCAGCRCAYSQSAQPEQEPVARVVLTQNLGLPTMQWLDLTRQFVFKGGEFLYTAPPKPWVGLTDEERRHFNNRLSGSGVAEEIEAKLKERQL